MNHNVDPLYDSVQGDPVREEAWKRGRDLAIYYKTVREEGPADLGESTELTFDGTQKARIGEIARRATRNFYDDQRAGNTSKKDGTTTDKEEGDQPPISLVDRARRNAAIARTKRTHSGRTLSPEASDEL